MADSKISTRYQLRDVNRGDIIDQNLSYEEALKYIDNSILGFYYIMEPMKKDSEQGDRNENDTLF